MMSDNHAPHVDPQKMMRKLSIVVLVFWFVCRWTVTAQMLYNPNDERFKPLYLEKVQNDYKVQKDDFERQKMLFEKKLISEREFAASEANFKNAQITYQQAILSLAFEQPHITIDKGIKYQSRDGKKRVKLVLRNTTGGLIEGRKVELQDFEGIRTDRISNVYISLVNDQNSIISDPYEAKIATMPVNEPVPVDFVLLQDLDNVTVKCVYGDKSEEKKIYLQKDESANKILITSEQFSQECDLGARANYDLTLDLFSSVGNVYQLEVFNLPPQVTHDFFETQTNARLSQVKFSQDVNTRKLTLAVYLPDRYDSTTLLIDRPITFYAVALPPGFAEPAREANQKYTMSDLTKLNVSFVRLELVPRGVGKIQVRATNFYQEIKPGEQVRMNLSIFNDGTRRLDNIKVQAEVPINWTSTVVPDLLASLPPGKEETVSVTIVPSADASIGDYEATIKTESFASNRKVDSEDKKIRIHLASAANIFGTILLIVLLLGVLLGVVIFGVRLSRK